MFRFLVPGTFDFLPVEETLRPTRQLLVGHGCTFKDMAVLVIGVALQPQPHSWVGVLVRVTIAMVTKSILGRRVFIWFTLAHLCSPLSAVRAGIQGGQEPK